MKPLKVRAPLALWFSAFVFLSPTTFAQNCRGNFFDSLHQSIESGQSDVVKQMLKQLRDDRNKDVLCEKPSDMPFFLETAIGAGNEESIQSLLAAGADIKRLDADGRTLLMHAAIDGRPNIVTFLLKAGLDVNARDSLGNTALDLAIAAQQDKSVALLKSAGATSASSGEHAAEIGVPRYVWAAQGVNLREAPSPTARVIEKLLYGRAVNVLAQSDKPVPFEMDFFAKATAPAKGAKPVPQVMISGEWVKVRTRGQEGYVFNRLLLAYPPQRQYEEAENYYSRLFDLTVLPAVEDKQSNSTFRYVAHGQRKVSLSKKLGVDHEGGEDLVIPDMPFDEAIVFFNAIEPVQPGQSVSYKRDMRLDESAGGFGQTLSKEGNGVHYRMTWPADTDGI